MSVLALDLGTKLGWAIRRSPFRHDLSHDGDIEHDCADFSPSGSDGEGMRFLRFRAWLHDVKRRLDGTGMPIDLIVFEKVDFVREGQAYNAHVWGGMWATVTAWAEHHQIPYRSFANNTIKKAVAGHGHADKAQVIAALRERGFKVSDHNTADAIAVLLTAQALELERAA